MKIPGVVSFFFPQHWPETLISLGILAAAGLPGVEGFTPSLSASLARYDPNLAILAITAIAVVWYTGSTARSLLESRLDRFESELPDLLQMHELLGRRLGFARKIQDEPGWTNESKALEEDEEELVGRRFSLRGRWMASIATYESRAVEIRKIGSKIVAMSRSTPPLYAGGRCRRCAASSTRSLP